MGRAEQPRCNKRVKAHRHDYGMIGVHVAMMDLEQHIKGSQAL